MFRIATWILLLLCSSAVISQGKDGAASFTECRVHIEAALNQYAANVDESTTTEVDQSSSSTETATEELPIAEEPVAATSSSDEVSPGEHPDASSEEAATSGESTEEAPAAEEPPADEASAEDASETSAETSASGDASAETPGESATEEDVSAEAAAVEELSAEAAAEETSAEATAEESSEEAAADAASTEESSAEAATEESSAETAEEAPAEGSGEEAPVEASSADETSAEAPAESSSAEEASAEATTVEETAEAPAAEESSAEAPAPEGEAAAEEPTQAEGEATSEEAASSEGTEAPEEAASEEADQSVSEGEIDEPELDAAEEVEPPPTHLRPREHVDRLLGVDESSTEMNEAVQRVARGTLKELKRVYDSSVKPLEAVYKYKDISTRHLGDPELYSKSMVLIMGPWGSGKSTFSNYLLGNEYTSIALKTGSQPGRGLFNIVEFGESEATLDGAELVAQWEFSSLQKFGQAFLQHLQGHRMPNRLLEKVTLVDMPGIVERGKQLERDYPFNDVCQWFIDRSDLILVLYDPTRLDTGLEMEALFDQLKGREPQVRIVLNKADMVRPQDLMRVQGNLFWSLSPLLGSSEPPVIYAGSFWSRLYRPGAPIRLFRAQEEALLLDIRDAFESRVENRIALTRRHAVRVRNHAKMVDCYLNTFYSQKSFFGNKKKVAGEIVDNPGEYRIYEGISTLTNVSRYDLPDPDIYKDFFGLHPLYDFPTLQSTCTYFRGCPLDKLDVAISYNLPELLGKHRKSLEQAIVKITAGRGQ